MKRRSFLRSTSAKTNWALILIVLVGAGVLLGFIQIPGLDLSNFDFPWSISGSSGLVDVNKKIQFSVTNKYSGAVANGKELKVYDADSLALLDTLTTAATGLIQTTANYKSGRELYVKYTDGNSLVWYHVVVPQMNLHDSEANTYNDIALEEFAVGTYTSDRFVASSNATIIADGDAYNKTSTAVSTPVFTYTLQNTGADNTGIMNSELDPLYNKAWLTIVEIKISGTNWETVVISGVDRLETIGSAYYAYLEFSPEQLTKWKIGNNYVTGYSGTESRSFNLDLTGYSGDAATMQITARTYADPTYAVAHGGSLGPSIVTIAEQTIPLED